MRLSAPKKSTFCISVVLLVIGILGKFFIGAIEPISMYFMIVSNLLLIAGCCIKDF